MIILGHHYVTISLAKMLIWAPLSQPMCTFYLSINPWAYTHQENVLKTTGVVITLIAKITCS